MLLAWVAAIIACTLAALPLFLTDLAPLQDWPSHLARIEILNTMMAGPSHWDGFYDIDSFFLPNIVLEAVTLPLLKLGLGIDIAGHIFLALLYTIFVAGFCRFAAACNNLSPLKLLFAALLFYNSALFYGLVNFEFGLGMMMLVLGIWIDGGPKVRLASGMLGVAAIFPCHLVAAFLFVFILGCFDLQALAQRKGRGMLRSTSLGALAVAVLFLALSSTGHEQSSVSWADSEGVGHLIKWKLGLFVKALLGRSLSSDLAYAGGMAVLVGAVVTSFRTSLATPIAFAVAAVSLLALLAPQRIGDGSLFDYRIAVAPWLLLAAGIGLKADGVVTRNLVFMCGLLLVLARGVSLTVAGTEADTQYAVLDRSFAKLPKDSILLSGLARPLTQVSWAEFWTVSGSAIASRASRYGVFVPSIFADAGQQPLVLKAIYKPWNRYIDVSSPELLDQERKRARGLCAAFPAGVSMLVLYPKALEDSEMTRVGKDFGLLNMCKAEPQAALS